MKIRSALVATVVLTAGGLAATQARAQAQDDRYWVQAAGYWPRIDTSVSVSTPNLPGSTIDFEKDLGLDQSQALGTLAGGMRFGQKWILAGEIYALDRDGGHTLSRDINFDGVTYPVNATVNSDFKSLIYRATLGYSFFKSDNYEVGAAIGLHATDFKMELNGQASVGGGGPSTVQAHKRDFLAPLPTIGLYANYDFNPKVTFNGRVDYLSLKIGDYDGGVTNLQANVAYRFNQTWAVGGGYRYVSYDLDVSKDDRLTKVRYDFSGPELFLRIGFR